MKEAISALLVCLALINPAAAGREESAGHLYNLSYAARGHDRQKLDLHLPPGRERAPLIIWIHGGAWQAGDKSQRVPLEYLDEGFAVASINYRLSRHAVFPAQIQDCKAAVRWLRAHADEFGLDGERFAAWGESAGGHLASLLGTAGDIGLFEVGGNLEYSSRVQAVVDCFGPTDFLQMDEHRVPEGLRHDPAGSPESRLIGGPIRENRDLTGKANPVTYITADDPPFLIIHGDADPLVPHHQSILLNRSLESAGVPVTFHTVRGGGHGGFKGPEVPGLIKAFLLKYLKPARAEYTISTSVS